MTSTDIATSIVKIAGAFLIGILFLSAMAGDMRTVDSVTVSFDFQPSDGDTVTLDGHTFEFDTGDGVVAGRIPVTIGDSLAETSNNLRIAAGTYYSTV